MTTPDESHRLAAEHGARALLDRQFRDATWSVEATLTCSLAAVSRRARVIIVASHGRADDLLYT